MSDDKVDPIDSANPIKGGNVCPFVNRHSKTGEVVLLARVSQTVEAVLSSDMKRNDEMTMRCTGLNLDDPHCVDLLPEVVNE